VYLKGNRRQTGLTSPERPLPPGDSSLLWIPYRRPIPFPPSCMGGLDLALTSTCVHNLGCCPPKIASKCP
jgi:hypothetical protein